MTPRFQQVQSSTYLGATLNQDVTLNLQVDCTVNQANRSLGALRRGSNFIPQDTRSTMYNALVLPHLDYCAIVLGHCGGRSD